MKLSKSKRQHIRKKAAQHQEQLTLMEISVDELLETVEELEDAQDELKSKRKHERTLMAAIDNLNSAIVNLTLAVDNAVAALGTPTTGVPEADVQAAADAVTAQTTRLVTATPTTPAPPPS